MFTDTCIYTIVHSDKLRSAFLNGGDTFSERKVWAKGKSLVAKAQKDNQRVPIIFAPAEDTRRLFAFAILDKVVIRGKMTTYTFSEMSLFTEKRPLKSVLRKASDGTGVDPMSIWPYIICKTPKTLLHRLRPNGPSQDRDKPYTYELDASSKYFEGAIRKVLVNAYERNPRARLKCIQHYGTVCDACGFNFEETYGPDGTDVIHVHHTKMLSEIGDEYEVDPIRDLRPVCPNCHEMIHRRKPPFEIQEIKALIRVARRRKRRLAK